MLYDTAKAALEELSDPKIFEDVVCWLLESKYPQLRPTSTTSDLARDGYVRPLFTTDEETVLWISLEKDWKSKLKYELEQHRLHGRTARAVFATSANVTEAAKEKERRTARTDYGVDVEIVARRELLHLLARDDLRWVAEVHLGVAPRVPDRLVLAGAYLHGLTASVAGMNAPLVDAEAAAAELRTALTGPARVIVVEGPGGIGKTRQVLEAVRSWPAALVLPTGAPLEHSCLARIPLNHESVLIIDDAHRCPDLGALPSLLADPRFNRVGVVLIVRPSYAHSVRVAAGIEALPAYHLELQPLGQQAVDAIVMGHRIISEDFRRRVIGLADGNPLIAHTACEVALATGEFGWKDASQLLADLVTNRLGGDSPQTRELRAVAVALALRGVAGNDSGVAAGQDLAEFAGTVTALPTDPGRLETLVGELADRGLADGPPYTLRPHLAAPVILGQALRRDAGTTVRLDLEAALRRLDEFVDRQGEQTTQGRAWVDVFIGPRLADLAVAVRDSADPAFARQLAAFVRVYMPDEPADLTDWSIVISLAQRIVTAVPTIVAELHRALVRRWPLGEEPEPDETQYMEHWQGEHGYLARLFTTLAGHADAAGQPGTVAAVLDLAYLCDKIGPRLVPLADIAKWRLPSRPQTPEGEDELMELRNERLEAIAQWARDRAAEPPEGLWKHEANRRGMPTIARVVVEALTPLLSGFITTTTYGTTTEADTYAVRQLPLPHHPDLPPQLAHATDLLADFLKKPELHQPQHLPILMDIVATLGTLHSAAGHKITGSGDPVPAYVQQAFADAAAAMSARIADCWADLPLAARRRALDGALRRPGGKMVDISEAANDPVILAACHDPALRRLLVVQPPHSTHAQREREAERWRTEALALAGQVTTDEALQLLAAADPQAPATSALPAFARTVGASADPAAVLAFLDTTSAAGEEFLLAGTAERHPDQVWAWLTELMPYQQRMHVLALEIADEHPDRELQLLEHLTEVVRADPDGLEGSAVAEALTRHLLSCSRPTAERLDRLATIGLHGPAEVLPQVLNAIGLLLGFLPAGHDHPGLTARCLAATGRILAEATEAERRRTNPRRDKDGAAYGAELVAGRHPAAFARLLADHFTAGRPLPLPWENTLRDLPANIRETLAVGILDHWPPPAEDPRPERHAAHGITVIASDTPAWDTAVRRWAQGPPRERARAAETVRTAWATPTWSAVVPSLLTAGIGPEITARLLEGFTHAEYTRDLIETLPARRAVLQPLRTHPHPAVRDFVTRADAALSGLPDTLEGT